VAAFKAGEIVIADSRGDALPKEPNQLRPAVVIEDHELFSADYPNVILVPLSDDPALAILGLAETIDPTPENACTKRCFALAPFVSCTASARVRATGSKVTHEQLARIRRQVAEAIGLS
jgi:hypothetical protein